MNFLGKVQLVQYLHKLQITEDIVMEENRNSQGNDEEASDWKLKRVNLRYIYLQQKKNRNFMMMFDTFYKQQGIQHIKVLIPLCLKLIGR